MIDGATDYPIAFGRQTYQDSLVPHVGGGQHHRRPDATRTTSPWSGRTCATARCRRRTDPYAATTNSDVIVSQSFDRGATWSAPTAIAAAGDQFMPWGAYDASGTLRDRHLRPQLRRGEPPYDYTLLTERRPAR